MQQYHSIECNLVSVYVVMMMQGLGISLDRPSLHEAAATVPITLRQPQCFAGPN